MYRIITTLHTENNTWIVEVECPNSEIVAGESFDTLVAANRYVSGIAFGLAIAKKVYTFVKETV
jgi:hypothetical protein